MFTCNIRIKFMIFNIKFRHITPLKQRTYGAQKTGMITEFQNSNSITIHTDLKFNSWWWRIKAAKSGSMNNNNELLRSIQFNASLKHTDKKMHECHINHCFPANTIEISAINVTIKWIVEMILTLKPDDILLKRNQLNLRKIIRAFDYVFCERIRLYSAGIAWDGTFWVEFEKCKHFFPFCMWFDSNLVSVIASITWHFLTFEMFFCELGVYAWVRCWLYCFVSLECIWF